MNSIIPSASSAPGKTNRRGLIILIVLLLFGLTAGALLWRANARSLPREEPVSPAVQAYKEGVRVVVELPDGPQEYAVPLTTQATAWAVMQLAQDQGLVIGAKDFGGSLGIFIESLGGVPGSGDKYWQLYVNDQLSPVGVSAATVTAGDILTWKLEEMHGEE